jgi:hypothetical protein
MLQQGKEIMLTKYHALCNSEKAENGILICTMNIYTYWSDERIRGMRLRALCKAKRMNDNYAQGVQKCFFIYNLNQQSEFTCCKLML